jgi:hypothetical protein
MRFERLPDTMPNMKVWMAVAHGYSFCISEETEDNDPEWFGYNASWKNASADMKPFGQQRANLIDGGPWRRFRDAERACEQTLRQLMVKQ